MFQIAHTGTYTIFMTTLKTTGCMQHFWTRTRQRARASCSARTGYEWQKSFLSDTSLLTAWYWLEMPPDWRAVSGAMWNQKQVAYTKLYRETWVRLRWEELRLFSGIITQVIIETFALWLFKDYVISCYNHPARVDYDTDALISKIAAWFHDVSEEKTNNMKENPIALIITWVIILKPLFFSGSENIVK